MESTPKQLREYAGNPGYSHGDYADTMRIAADEIEGLRVELAATGLGLNSALHLQRVFTANADVREARALHNYAGTKLDLALFREQIASAISRGHLSADFYANLKEWSK